jgi:hypothetical protein
MRIIAPCRLRRWREGKVRPIQGNPPHDRLVSRVISLSLKERLRRSLPRHSVAARNSRAPGNAFLRHGGIYLSDAGTNPSLDGSCCLPPAAPDPSQRTCREEHALLIVQMSSGRLFLDRVARQHCPSPLHRHPDNKTVDRSEERIYYRTVTVSFPRVSPEGFTPEHEFFRQPCVGLCRRVVFCHQRSCVGAHHDYLFKASPFRTEHTSSLWQSGAIYQSGLGQLGEEENRIAGFTGLSHYINR